MVLTLVTEEQLAGLDIVGHMYTQSFASLEPLSLLYVPPDGAAAVPVKELQA